MGKRDRRRDGDGRTASTVRRATSSRPRRWLQAAFVLLALGAVIASGAARLRKVRTWNEATRRMGLRWPGGVRARAVVRGTAPLGERWISGFALIPRGEVEHFIAENGLRPLDAADLSFVFGLERMPRDCQRVRHPRAVWGRAGLAADGLPYEIVTDAESGEVWFNVICSEGRGPALTPPLLSR